MALKVWLPLTGTLENKGISVIEFNQTGSPTVNAEGKIGSCYYFDGSSYFISKTNTYLTNMTECSFACWIKNTYTGSSYMRVFGVGTHKRAHLDITNTGKLRFFVSKNGTNNTYWGPTGTTDLRDSTWHHICGTFNNKECKVYVDGICEATVATNDLPTITGGQFEIGHIQDGIKMTGYLNDLRMYDHCLSAKEVKEISQGLILHYKLDGWSGGAGENLAIGTNTASTSTNVFNQSNQTGGITKEIVYEDGIPCVKITRDSTAQSGWKFLSYNNFDRSKIKVSTNYTVSFDIKAPVNGTISFTGLVQSNATQYMTQSTSTEQGNFSANMWSHLVFHCITKSSFDDVTIGSQIIYFSPPTTLVNTNISYLLKNMKLEEGSTATAWTPTISEMGIDTTKIVDSSGYGNNGIINGDIITKTNDSNEGRYNVYTQFNGSNTYINAGKNAKVKDEITVAWWGYMDTWSSYTRAISCTEGGGWNFEPSSGKLNFAMGTGATSNTYKSCTSNTTLASLSSGWHHFVGTYSGLDSKLYIDGVLDRTLNCYTTKTPIFYNANNNIIIGAEANGSTGVAGSYYNGKLSDVRIYAAALSAEDIADLYHTPANIDNLQNIHSFEFEENGIKTSVYQNGVMSTIDEIHESNAELLNDFTSGGYTPTANTQNSCVTLGIVDFTKYASNGEDLAIHIECDLEWTAFTAGTGGTFNGFWWQGANWQLNGTSGVWQGTNYIAQALTSQKTLRNATDSTTAGKYHYNTTAIIPASWFDTYNKSNIGFRCDYSDGVGKITVNNFKATPLQYYNAKIGEDFISANNFIEK